MDLHLNTDLQCQIADLLWSCKTVEQVECVINTFGQEARAIQMLMVYTAIDDECNEPTAEIIDLIKKISQ